MGFCRSELNTLAGGGGTMVFFGVGLAFGLVLGQSGFRLENDLADLLESESRDPMLLGILEYDLVIGLGSLTIFGLGSFMMADGRLGQGWMDGCRKVFNAKIMPKNTPKMKQIVLSPKNHHKQVIAPKQGYTL